MLYTGGFFKGVPLAEAFANCSSARSLVLGSFLTLIFTFILYIPRKVLAFVDFCGSFAQGFKAMTSAIMILCLAWTLSGICGAEYLNIQGFVKAAVGGSTMAIAVMPVIFFLISLGLAFATGTSWGTFGILIPISVTILSGNYMMMSVCVGAILAGAVCGDHISPISDTTILSSAGAQCRHIDHVSTQMPYALTVALCASIGYILSGVTGNGYIGLASALASLAVVMAIIVMSKILMDKKVIKSMEEINRVMIGKERTVHQIMTAILAGGHVLIEDIPGVGKTTLALAFSKVLGLSYQRIQFTPDIMPTDIAGFSIYHMESETFEYREGAAMTNLLLADEINRTSPKTQSALLEAMEEGKITVDGVTRDLPDPYIVLATQNPLGSIGTHTLPESQLDRFMIRTSLGYPDMESEVQMLMQGSVDLTEQNIKEQISAQELKKARKEVKGLFVHEDIIRYIVEIANETRRSRDLELGITQRGTIALLSMAKANAYLDGRNYVIPEDIKNVFLETIEHRVIKSKEARIQKKTRKEILKDIFYKIPLPKGNQKG